MQMINDVTLYFKFKTMALTEEIQSTMRSRTVPSSEIQMLYYLLSINPTPAIFEALVEVCNEIFIRHQRTIIDVSRDGEKIPDKCKA